MHCSLLQRFIEQRTLKIFLKDQHTLFRTDKWFWKVLLYSYFFLVYFKNEVIEIVSNVRIHPFSLRSCEVFFKYLRPFHFLNIFEEDIKCILFFNASSNALFRCLKCSLELFWKYLKVLLKEKSVPDVKLVIMPVLGFSTVWIADAY